MKIVATAEIGRLGPSESEAAFVDWQWQYQIPRLVPWMLIGLLLVLPKANRNWQAWTILVPLGLLLALSQALAGVFPTLFSIRSSLADVLGFLVASLALAWITVWLAGHWLARAGRAGAFFVALALMLTVGAIAGLGDLGTENKRELMPFLILYCVGVAALLLAVTLSRVCCGKTYRPARFLLWLLVWTVLIPVAALLVIIMPTAPSRTGPREILTFVVMPAAVLGGLLYLINLPVMALAFLCPFYRDRFQGTLRLKGLRAPTDGMKAHDAAEPPAAATGDP